MNWTLELIVVPVTDIDRAKAFYVDQVGFDVNVDHTAGDFRVVQLDPKGSGCSISMVKGNPATAAMAPGSLQGVHLCVSDLDLAREELIGRGVDVSEMFHFGEQGQQPGPDPQRQSYNSFMTFNDPDGNGWLVQEVKR